MKGPYSKLVEWVGGEPTEQDWLVGAYAPGMLTNIDNDILVAVTLDWPEDACDRYDANLNT